MERLAQQPDSNDRPENQHQIGEDRRTLLSLDDPDAAIDAQWPQLRRVRKPFGVHELRRVLASLLAAGGVAFRNAGS